MRCYTGPLLYVALWSLLNMTGQGQRTAGFRYLRKGSGLSCNFDDFTTCSWTFLGGAMSLLYPSETNTTSDYVLIQATNNSSNASNRSAQLAGGTAVPLLSSSWMTLSKPTQLYIRYFPIAAVYSGTQLRIWALVGESERVVDIFPDYADTAKYRPQDNGQWIRARLAVCITGERLQLVIGGQSTDPSQPLVGLGLGSLKLLDEDAIAVRQNYPISPPGLRSLDSCGFAYPDYENSITCTWIPYANSDRPAKFCGWSVPKNISAGGYSILSNSHDESAGKFLRIMPDPVTWKAFVRLSSPQVVAKYTGQTTFSFRAAMRSCQSCMLLVNVTSHEDGVSRQTYHVLPGTLAWRMLYSVDVHVVARDRVSFEFVIDLYQSKPNPITESDSWTGPLFDLDRTWYDAEPGFEWNTFLHDEIRTTTFQPNSGTPAKHTDETKRTVKFFPSETSTQQTTPSNPPTEPGPAASLNGTPDRKLTLGLGIGLGLTFPIVVVAVIVIWVSNRRRRRFRGTMRRNLLSKVSRLLDHDCKRDIPISEPSVDDITSTRPLDTLQYDISPETLEITDTVLGRGEFGIVFKGLAKKLPTVTRGPTVVAVKMLVENAGKDKLSSFAAEYRVMLKAGHHVNVVRILGIVQQEKPCIVLEYCRFGSLRTYLRSRRHGAVYEHVDASGRLLAINEDDMEKQWMTLCRREDRPMNEESMAEHMLSTNNLISFSHQICRGMEYLVSRSIIHRDLAARNILVSEHHVVKVSDFGLARHGCESYSMSSLSTTLPILWRPPETIIGRTFSEKSDVWSFGILLWEIFSLGALPFDRPDVANLTSLDFADWSMKGHQMDRPDGAPHVIYNIMQICWTLAPDKRPTFSAISPMRSLYRCILNRQLLLAFAIQPDIILEQFVFG